MATRLASSGGRKGYPKSEGYDRNLEEAREKLRQITTSQENEGEHYNQLVAYMRKPEVTFDTYTQLMADLSRDRSNSFKMQMLEAAAQQAGLVKKAEPKKKEETE